MGDMNFWTNNQKLSDENDILTFQDYNIQSNSGNFEDPTAYTNALDQSPVTSFDGYQYTTPKNLYQNVGNNFDDEIPLLEELEIEPDKILKRMLLILDPFTSPVFLEEYDLMGPLILFFLLPSILLLSAKAYFSHVCGFGVVCSFFMWTLLYLMSSQYITFSTVTSILGYGLLPQIILAAIGVILPLYSILGFVLALFCILWSSFATSRIFVIMMNSSESQQQSLLIAYPCALLYSVFSLLVLF